MRSIYFVSFLLGKPEGDEEIDQSGVIAVIDDWIFQRPEIVRPENFILSGNFDITAEPNFRIVGRQTENETHALIGLQFRHPDSESRDWRTSIVIAKGKSENRATRVSIDVSLGRQGEAMAPVRISPSRPRIVPELINRFGAHERYPLRAEPINIETSEAKDFCGWLTSKERRLPIIFASRFNHNNAHAVDVNKLANRLAGLASVCSARSSDLSWALRDLLDDQLNTYGGAIRIYWPGFSNTDSTFRHRLWTPRYIEAFSTQEDFIQRVLGTVAQVSIARHLEQPCRWEDLERILSRQLRRQLRDEGKDIELVEMAEEFIGELEADKELKQLEIERLLSDLEAAKSEAEQWRTAYQDSQRNDQQQISQIKKTQQLPAATLDDAVAMAVANYPGKLFVLPSAMEDEARLYENPEGVYDALKWLATVYLDARTGKASCSNLNLSCKENCGFSYSGGQSEVTMGQYRNEYEKLWDGEKIKLEEHIGIGSGKDPRRTIRIAFYFDINKKLTLVGYIGQHQRTRAT